MRVLDQKLLRDLWSMKGQMLAICLVMGSGVATFVMSLSTLESLETSQANYYQHYRFADVFAGLKRAPRSLEDRIREIPGVDHLQTRVVMDVNLDVAGMPEPAVGRLISIPERTRPTLNAPHLRQGRYLEPGRAGEVLVSEAFAVAHDLKPGDRVDAIINGAKESLKIVGVAISPEYVYQLKGGDMFPDDRHFGVFWMGYLELSSGFNMEGGFNDVSLSLTKGASEREVIKQLDQLIRPYGGLGAFGREEQLSHRFLSDELKGLRGSGLIMPLIFLSVAGFLLNVVMTRMISTQREQIAALKAFGYTNREVGFHYMKLVLLISIISAILGCLVGLRLSEGLTALYARFYRFPVFEVAFNLQVLLAGLAVSCLSGGVSVLGAVYRAVRLPPAEAMRPEPPASFQVTFLERWGLRRFLSQTFRIILRQIERKPVKMALSCAGIAIAASLLVMGHSMNDSIEYMMEYQFFMTQRQDLSLNFVEPRSITARHEVSHMPGVIRTELFRSAPVRLISRYYEKRIGIMGLEADHSLNRLLDENTEPVRIPEAGMLLSEKLAELLHVSTGDIVTVEVLEGKRPVRDVVVTGTVGGYAGVSAYMRLDALNRLLQEGPLVSGAFVQADATEAGKLYRLLKETPAVAGVTVKATALQSFRDTIGENMLAMNFFNLLFACIIACGVIYNIARISLSERSHELATLRVIGFTRYEISAILLGELAVVTLIAIPFGLGLGYFFSWLVSFAYDTELYRIPFVVERATYGRAVVIILLASLASGLIVRRKLDRLDLVSVLKSYD